MTEALYLYGALSPETPAEALAHLADLAPIAGGGPPRAVSAGPVLALVSAHAGDPPAQRRRNLLAHTRVLEAAMAAGTVLPVRFGTIAETPDALTHALTTEAVALGDALERLAGHAAFGLRIAWPREAVLAEILAQNPALEAERQRLVGRGAEAHFDKVALGRRVAEALESARRASERRTLAALTPSAKAHAIEAPQSDTETLRAEFLLPDGSDAAFLARVEAEAQENPFAPGAEPDIRLIGPTPAYHFVSLSLSATLQAAPRREEAG